MLNALVVRYYHLGIHVIDVSVAICGGESGIDFMCLCFL
jgi:hypothetical protein